MYIYNAHVNAAEALYLCCKFTFEYKIHAQKLALDCGYRSVVEHLPNMPWAQSQYCKHEQNRNMAQKASKKLEFKCAFFAVLLQRIFLE
jgi:hypothetical protein